MTDSFTAEGGCTCGNIRYRMNRSPMFVHCCHCRWCQKESGTAFALNAILESSELELLSGETERVELPSESGKGQTVIRCPDCKIAVWSHYSTAGDATSLVRVGTLDNPDLLPPDVHIFTESRQPWVQFNTDLPEFEQFYSPKEVWPPESLERLKAVFD